MTSSPIAGTRPGWVGRGIRIPRPPAVLWLPALFVALAIMLPQLYLLLRTLGAGNDVWTHLFRPRTLEIILQSLGLTAAVAAASLAISLPLAWLTVRTDLPFRRFWAVVTALPLVIPSYVAGLAIIAAFGPRGMLQQMLAAPFGIERIPDIYGFPGALIAVTVVTYPYLLLALQASLRNIDPCLEEASRSLGFGAWATFRRITLPQLRPAIAAGSLLVVLYTLRDFGAVSLMRYETFTWAIYIQYQTSFDRMAAAALSLVLVIIAVIILITETYTRGRGKYHRSTVGVIRPPGVTKLGKWKLPALIFCSALVLLTLVLPVSVLSFWAVRGLIAGEQFQAVWWQMLNSVYSSAFAAVIIALGALPVAILSVRYPSWISRILERATYVGFALPGIVVALALVFFSANYATPIYQTLAVLLFAYLILFLPQAVGPIRTSLLQVSPRVEEAARSLGRTASQTITAVTLPLVKPGILAGAALVFLTTMKELPATLILSPIGFRTLATSVWSLTSEAFFARAAVPALLLILLSSIPMALMTIRGKRDNR